MTVLVLPARESVDIVQTCNSSGCWHYSNCYNYALGVMSYSERYHPGGEMWKRTYSEGLPEAFRQLAIQDGLRPVPSNGLPYGWHLVYYCFSNTYIRDYHWFRMDADGFWSHKMGNQLASYTQTYDDSKRIYDPIAEAESIGYDQYGGFLMVPPTLPAAVIAKIEEGIID